MKNVRYVLLILLLFTIPCFVVKAGGSGTRHECIYTFNTNGKNLNNTLVPGDKSATYYWMVNFQLTVTDDNGEGDESDGPYGMTIYASLYRNGTYLGKYNSSDNWKKLFNLDGGEARFNGTRWDYFLNAYMYGTANSNENHKLYDDVGDDGKSGESGRYDAPRQECPQKVYVKKVSDRFQFRANSNDSFNIEATLLKTPKLTCHYSGFILYDWHGWFSDDSNDYVYYDDIPLNFTMTYNTGSDVIFDSTTKEYKLNFSGKWRLSTIDHIWAEAACKAPTGNTNSVCKDKSLLLDKDGKKYGKVNLNNPDRTWTGCPVSFGIENAGGVEVSYINTRKDKVGNNGITYKGVFECEDPTGSGFCPTGNGQGYGDVEVEKPHIYENVELCDESGINYIKQCGCMPASLTDLTSRIYLLLKIATPALLLIIGGFEMVKAMTASDESAIKKAQQKLIKKFVAAAMVFLLMTIVQFLASVLGTDGTTLECVDYILNGYQI